MWIVTERLDYTGMLTPESPVRLSLPGIAGIDPTIARGGAFSPVAFGDRLALVASSSSASVLVTAKVERDSTLKILSDLVAVGDLYALGLPDPNFLTEKGFTGFIDSSPDGRSIVASIYYDLWMIHLNADHTFLSSERITENTDGFAEWNPSFSPDGSRIAYSAGPITNYGGVRDPEIYSLTLAARAVLQVTTKKNKGEAARLRNNAMWTADSIGFTAFTSRTPRRSPCSGLVNSEIFLIKADGSITATKITNTNGTSVEVWPKWGW
jgi:Tol biopolymer transport system component